MLALFSGGAAGDYAALEGHLDGAGVSLDKLTIAAASELLRNVCGCVRRPGLERVLRFAAPAFPVPQDAVDHAELCDKGDDAHAAAALTQLHDSGRVQGREQQEFPIGGESAIGDKSMAMGIEVGPVGAIGL